MLHSPHGQGVCLGTQLSLGIQFQFFSLDCKPVPPCSLGAARELPVTILGDLTVIIKSLQLLSSRRHNSSFFY